MSDIICDECGHSIEKHGKRGCEVGWGNVEPEQPPCNCFVPHDVAETRHQLKQMTAERDRWKEMFKQLQNEQVEDYEKIKAERDVLRKQLEMAREAMNIALYNPAINKHSILVRNVLSEALAKIAIPNNKKGK